MATRRHEQFVQDVARMHVGLILAGMGYSDLVPPSAPRSFSGSARSRDTARLRGHDGRENAYLGVTVGPAGVLPVSLREAQAMAGSLAGTGRLGFAGVDIDVVRRLRDNLELSPMPRRSDGALQIGTDGFLYAPIDQVTPHEVSF